MTRNLFSLLLLCLAACAQQPAAPSERAAPRGAIDGRLTWFDRQGKAVGTIGDPGVYRTLTISPDGKRVASGHAYGGVCIWTAATNKCDGYIQAHRTAVFSLVWSPDGEKLATGGGVIRIWDMQTGKLLTAFGENDKVVYAHIAWPSNVAPLVALETGLDDQSKTAVRYWDISTGTSSVEIIGTEP